MGRRPSTTKGFQRTGSVLSDRIRRAGETRGFAVTRLLTHWEEIAGADVAKMAQPVDVSYSRRGKHGGMGATLSLLTTGPMAPMLEMQKDRIRARVNACYGYNAIARIRITQTAPTGFAEAQSAFAGAPKKPMPPVPTPEIQGRAAQQMAEITDPDLKAALTQLGAYVMSKQK